MPTGRRGERSGWRSGIRHALFKVSADYMSDREKMFMVGKTFDAPGMEHLFSSPEVGNSVR